MKVSLSTEPIRREEILSSIRSESSGAIVTFTGTVRKTESGDLESLFYEAYEEMAVKEMQKICMDALQRFSITDIAMSHRIGNIGIGEESVFIAVSAPHRKEAFLACEYAIDSLKKSVPIWKKDVYRDSGSGRKK